MLVAALAIVATSCAATPAGELHLVAADQTVENPIRDVLEVVISGEAFYPDLAAGGSPILTVEWMPGDTVDIDLWPNAVEESPIHITLAIPTDREPGGQLTLVAEVEDNTVRIFNTALGFSLAHDRFNPVATQRAEEAAAEAAAKEEEAASAKAAEDAKQQEEDDLVAKIRAQAERLGSEMDGAYRNLSEVLEEDGTIYGDDGSARLTAIAKKYENYTTQALEDLKDGLPSIQFGTDPVATLNDRWLEWWDDFVALHGNRWIAADNGDTVSLTRIGERIDALWDEWAEILDRLDALRTMKPSDL